MRDRSHRWALALLLGAVALSLSISPAVRAAEEKDDFKSIFDGKSLDNWDGNPKFWKVEDGAITGQTTADNPTSGNTFIIWRGGKLGDFELRLKFRIVGGNSGIQYRSREVEKWVISGYQADFDGDNNWTGTLYEERGRGVLARRGDKVVVHDDGAKGRVGKTAEEKEIVDSIKKEDWNDYRVIAEGNHLRHYVNDILTVDLVDEQEDKRAMDGLLALQLHAGPPMLVQFKDIRLKELAAGDKKEGKEEKKDARSSQQKKKVVFVAGKASHGYGSHEHYAGCVLLAKALEQGMPNIKTEVVRNGWPQDSSVFEGADAIVIYSDGGGGHPAIPHLDELDKLSKKGVGLVCIHYAVEVPKGEPGDRFLDVLGGYFEPHWSVNPHWRANFKKLPEHAITRGVQPFDSQDEWYYHMRFPEGMKHVTPILTDNPPANTLSRPDGPHSGNPAVREAIAKGEPQHVAWAYERPDGGRGFGFTGGHFHWNWGEDNFRKLVLNAIVWAAKGDVPEEGVSDKPVTLEDLEKNQDFQQPANFDREKTRQEYDLKAQTGDGAEKKTTRADKSSAKPAFVSPLLTTAVKGHAVPVEADLAGAKELYLVVTDGGNGFGCDWADWAEPRLIGPKGELKLTDLKWKSASSEWGQVRVGQNADGGPLRINDKPVEYGIGTHANSVIVFDVPEGYNKFVARAGLDNGGTDQGGGGSSSVTFAVYTQRPPAFVLAGGVNVDANTRNPEQAVEGLEVAEGLEATLFASEPQVLNLTNLDIDHRGRVWACEVVNYRKHDGKRPEGDRILILEDTDSDGQADKTTVYYQGRDVDSAMGICVLGNQVIVSATPNIWVFTDLDGDDKPDRKEALFTKTGQPQHDHSAHSFLFGPDGKLYWNFGNTGKAVHDREGKLVVDKWGRQVVDNGKPLFGGMVFRCNPDGSEFEVLAHNFRNNYEVTVDSFGTLWQSDNDDDGNRGVRINYVMEFGNFGYLDEKTGAAWRTPRTNLEAEVPLQHWHLNDPGVVPNLVQTGAGSPTGITIYEDKALPQIFQNQVIHCDAGPNIVRAYPAKADGAGYEAHMENILEGTRDKWFRPADVCVAPDGSLFVTDWYDPGVGGHNMQDLERGRLFRIAAPGKKYAPPKFDFSTPQGAVAALKNSNYSVRYMAWTALREMGNAAEPALKEMFEKSDNPRHRARALWVLGKLPNRGEDYVEAAISDSDPDIRIVGLRLVRQLDGDIRSAVKRLVRDSSPQVRRECAIALRNVRSPEAAALWAELAAQHDGKDRWQLEALGIGAELQWDACLAAYLEKVGDKWSTPAGRDIIWRSRSSQTPALLAKIIQDKSVPLAELPRYLRSYDFVESPDKDAVLAELAFSGPAGGDARAALVVTEAAKRLNSFDANSNPQRAAALDKALDELYGTSSFVELVSKFNFTKRYGDLLTLAQQQANQQVGVEAIRALLAKGQADLINKALASEDRDHALATIEALGNSADNHAVAILMPLVRGEKHDLELRRQATRAAARLQAGAKRLIELARANELDEQLKQAASFSLNASLDEGIRSEAARLFPLPPPKDGKPLPPVAQLVQRNGNVERGKHVYQNAGQCAKCHVVNGQGKEVGPNLSEIGGKLAKAALYESILYPSAGISHNYETYALATADGAVVSGVLVSRTNEEVAIKSDDAIIRKFPTSEIDQIKKLNISLMPANLQQTMNAEELVDLVEYLTTLKKADGAVATGSN